MNFLLLKNMDISEEKKAIDKFFESKTDEELKELWGKYSFHNMKSNVVKVLPIDTLRENAEKWVFDINGDTWSNNDDTAPDNFGSFIMGATYILELQHSTPKINLEQKYFPKGDIEQWKFEFLKELISATNEELLDRVIENQLPDYDGVYSYYQKWRQNTSLNFLRDKLTNDNWL